MRAGLEAPDTEVSVGRKTSLSRQSVAISSHPWPLSVQIWCGLWLFTYMCFGTQVCADSKSICINEIFYHPAPTFERGKVPAWRKEDVEWVEICNYGAQAVNLDGYSLDSGVCFAFPSGTVIESGQFLVVAKNPQIFLKKYPGCLQNVLGPYKGKLKNSGDRIEIRDPRGEVIDSVEYDDRSPWPTLTDGLDYSLELCNPVSQHMSPSSWQASQSPGGTPGACNSTSTDQDTELGSIVIASAKIWNIHHPWGYDPSDALIVEARLTAREQPKGVVLKQQVVTARDYISLNDPRFADWTSIPMAAKPGGLFAAQIGPYPPETLVRWKIEAESAQGSKASYPRKDDQAPNQALFVGNPQHPESNADHEKVPLYLLLCSGPSLKGLVTKKAWALSSEPEYGSLVVQGTVYDHIQVTLRGAETRYRAGRKNLKVRFAQTDPLVFTPPTFVHSYPRKSLNLMAARELFGLHEVVGYKLYHEANVISPNVAFVHLRTLGDSPHRNDFSGLYLDIEDVNKRFFQVRGFSPCFIYKMEGSPVLKYSRKPSQGEGISELLAHIPESSIATWLRERVDLHGYLSFRAVSEIIQSQDLGHENYYLVKDARSRKWHIVPWDLNGAFGVKKVEHRDILYRPVFQYFPRDYERTWALLLRESLSIPHIEAAIKEAATLLQYTVANDCMATTSGSNAIANTVDRMIRSVHDVMEQHQPH